MFREWFKKTVPSSGRCQISVTGKLTNYWSGLEKRRENKWLGLGVFGVILLSHYEMRPKSLFLSCIHFHLAVGKLVPKPSNGGGSWLPCRPPWPWLFCRTHTGLEGNHDGCSSKWHLGLHPDGGANPVTQQRPLMFVSCCPSSVAGELWFQ